jgi:hypothetical protein
MKAAFAARISNPFYYLEITAWRTIGHIRALKINERLFYRKTADP